jgi:hypothetical protein
MPGYNFRKRVTACLKAVLRVRIFAKQSKQKVIIMAASRVTHTDKFNICGREAKKAATTVLDCSVIHGVTSHAKKAQPAATVHIPQRG